MHNLAATAQVKELPAIAGFKARKRPTKRLNLGYLIVDAEHEYLGKLNARKASTNTLAGLRGSSNGIEGNRADMKALEPHPRNLKIAALNDRGKG